MVQFNLDVPPSEYVGTRPEGAELLKRLLDNVEENPDDFIGLDTETYAKKIPIKTKADGSASKDNPLDWMQDTVTFWSLAAKLDGVARRWALPVTLLHQFVPLLEHPNALFGTWNGKYDAHVLFNSGIYVWNSRYVDGLAMGSLVDENLQGNLGLKSVSAAQHPFFHPKRKYDPDTLWEELVADGIVDEWIPIPMTKFTDIFPKEDEMGRKIKEYEYNIFDLFQRWPDRVADYASLDAHSTRMLCEHLRRVMKVLAIHIGEGAPDSNMWEYFLEMEKPCTEILWRMERRGMEIDTAYLESLVEPMTQELINIEKELNQEAGWPININSTPELIQLFFGAKDGTVKRGKYLIDAPGLGLKPIKMTKGGKTSLPKPSTDKDVLDELALQGVQAAKLIQRHRSVQKTKSTYVEAVVALCRHHLDGRLHPEFKQFGARTGRFCVAKGSLVEVVRDVSEAPKGIPIEKVKKGDLVYSYNDSGELCIRRVKWAGKTGHKKVMRVHWVGTGKKHRGYLDLTPEHEVRLTDGTWKRAIELNLHDSIAALSRDVDAWGYSRLYATGQKGYVKEHRFVFQDLFQSAPKVVHHKNGNKGDNRPENLEGTTLSAHSTHHGRTRDTASRKRTSVSMKKAWAEGKRRPPKKRTAVALAQLQGLTKESVEEMLRGAHWSITKASRGHGHDYNTFKRNVIALGFDLAELKQKHNDYRRSKGILGRRRGSKNKKKVVNNHTVIGLEMLEERVDVYDLEVEDTHNFIANELCVHNSTKTPNSQNFPRPDSDEFHIRSAFIAPEEKKLIVADYGQLEMRIMAHFSQDEGMLTAIKQGMDLHCFAVEKMYGIPYADVKAAKKRSDEVKYDDLSDFEKDCLKKRQTCKNTGFAIIYGAGAPRISAMLEIPLEDAKHIVELYFEAFPGVQDFMEDTVEDCQIYEYITTLVGRRRRLPDVNHHQFIKRSHAEREAVNSPIQGSAADITKAAMLAIESDPVCQELGVVIVNQIHDEIVCEVPAENAEAARARIKVLMEKPFYGQQALIVPTPVDAKIVDSWDQAK